MTKAVDLGALFADTELPFGHPAGYSDFDDRYEPWPVDPPEENTVHYGPGERSPPKVGGVAPDSPPALPALREGRMVIQPKLCQLSARWRQEPNYAVGRKRKNALLNKIPVKGARIDCPPSSVHGLQSRKKERKAPVWMTDRVDIVSLLC